jgi:hypothetical protein
MKAFSLEKSDNVGLRCSEDFFDSYGIIKIWQWVT